MRIKILLVVAAALTLGWTWLRDWQFSALDLPGTRPRPLVLGHAGSGFFTPFNPFNPLPPSSLAGVRHALAQGADGVEVDLQLSQDSVLMLYHDLELSNSTAGGTGCVSQYPAAELAQLRYRGGWPYDWFQKERVVTLDTLLQEFKQKATFPYLHFDLHEEDVCAAPTKTFARSPVLVRQLVRQLVQRQVPLGRVLVTSTQLPTLKYVRTLLPAVPVALEIVVKFDSVFMQAQAAGIKTVLVKKDQITPERAARIHAAGIQLVLFGGRSAGTMKKQLAFGPHAIETDNVAGLLSLLNRPVQKD
ncbi:hypothetical protein BEN47_15785 [Hymenobacter lapidarius]|uniref:GP-PDE domain-containing protein n=1 Tax=Hymenobacter lapidarius TaxID=1908237 RepID=A0A1G1T1N6_9BACT|nr:glycerophosphodiester phosphodiesterase [Hymenobacter lapidarius]OGX84795.1 hypothetical protein BEN47_15785 [Hymenobacter lapidarius]